jgi:hypothetical protein
MDHSMVVRDAVELADHLKGASTPHGMARALTIASAHRVGTDPLRASLPLAPQIAPLLSGTMLPALRDGIVAGVIGGGTPPDGGPTLIDMAGAFRILRALTPQLRHDPAVDALERSIRQSVQQSARDCTRSMTLLLGENDYPDITRLSLDMMRLDTLRWVTEELGHARANEELAYLSRQVARVTLGRAAMTVEAFLAERDLLTLFDNAAIVSQVDGLLTFAFRMLDAAAAGEEEETAFVETADQRALLTFITALSRLSGLLFVMMDKALERPGSGFVFYQGLVRQMDCLYRFCRGLDHEKRPKAVDGIEQSLHAKLMALADQAEVALDAAPLEGASVMAVARATLLAEVLGRIGLAVRADLLHAALARAGA